jgi:hypothetical protein
VKGYYIVKSELTQAKFDDFEKFVFLDIFTSFLFLLKVDNFGFAEQSYSVEKLLNEKERVVKKILSYSKSDIKNFIDGFAGKLKNVQINQLNCYKRLYYRITKTNQHNVTDFTKILDLQINLLSKESGTLTNDVTPDTIDKLVNEQKVPESSENEKLFIKDVAAILKCHHSPRVKMYFFYPEIIDWMKSHKQLSYLEEAGEVFKRKPRGAVKKRRPLLE